jgi:hypothetical protein
MKNGLVHLNKSLNLRSYPNPRISMKIKTPKTAHLGQIVQLEYTFEYLQDGRAFFVI